MKQPPRFTPHDAIFSPEPRFDPLPAALARRRRQRWQTALVILATALLLALLAGVWLTRSYQTAKNAIDATMTMWTRTQ